MSETPQQYIAGRDLGDETPAGAKRTAGPAARAADLARLEVLLGPAMDANEIAADPWLAVAKLENQCERLAEACLRWEDRAASMGDGRDRAWAERDKAREERDGARAEAKRLAGRLATALARWEQSERDSIRWRYRRRPFERTAAFMALEAEIARLAGEGQ